MYKRRSSEEHEHLSLGLQVILEVSREVSWKSPAPQREPDPAVGDRHERQRQEIHQHRHDPMISAQHTHTHTHTCQPATGNRGSHSVKTTAVCLSHQGVVLTPRPGHVADRPVRHHFGYRIKAERERQERGQNPHARYHTFRSRGREAGLHRVDDRHVPDQRGSDTGSSSPVRISALLKKRLASMLQRRTFHIHGIIPLQQ